MKVVLKPKLRSQKKSEKNMIKNNVNILIPEEDVGIEEMTEVIIIKTEVVMEDIMMVKEVGIEIKINNTKRKILEDLNTKRKMLQVKVAHMEKEQENLEMITEIIEEVINAMMLKKLKLQLPKLLIQNSLKFLRRILKHMKMLKN